MKWMTMREFLRGGYRDLDEPTVISNHGRPAFTVYPHTMTATSAHRLVELNTTDWGTSWNTLENVSSTTSSTTNSTAVRSHLPGDDEL